MTSNFEYVLCSLILAFIFWLMWNLSIKFDIRDMKDTINSLTKNQQIFYVLTQGFAGAGFLLLFFLDLLVIPLVLFGAAFITGYICKKLPKKEGIVYKDWTRGR